MRGKGKKIKNSEVATKFFCKDPKEIKLRSLDPSK